MTKKAIVTGASGAIGRAVALELAKQDIHVWLHYHKGASSALQTAEQINQQGGHAHTLGFDITNAKNCREQLDQLIKEQERMDIVVLNAGVSNDAPFAGMKPEQWTHVIDASLNSFYYVTRPLVMPMIRNRWGRIVSISSMAALHGSHGQSNYAAAKAGLIGASKSLARELATRGVCVNVVAPGFVTSAMIESVSEERIKHTVPMQRAGTPEEVANVVGFLCSPGITYLTGEVINVSGGIT